MSTKSALAPFAPSDPADIVWAKVPGWNWWPATVLRPGNSTADNDRLVLFLVDKTVARVPARLPQFDTHYSRFLAPAYSNKKLFQAVEEARGLLLEGSTSATAPEQLDTQQPAASVPPYPAPIPEDLNKSGVQLLKWLRNAATAPEVPLNKLSDQAYKRVLHAMRNNRRITQDVKPVVLAPTSGTTNAIPAAIPAVAEAASGPSARTATAASGLRQAVTGADEPVGGRSSKRQRKPLAWLQDYEDVPGTKRSRVAPTAAPAAKHPSGTGGHAADAAGASKVPGSKAAAAKAAARDSNSAAIKLSHVAKLRQQQQAQQQRQQQPAAANVRTTGIAQSGFGGGMKGAVVLKRQWSAALRQQADETTDSSARECISLSDSDISGSGSDVPATQQRNSKSACELGRTVDSSSAGVTDRLQPSQAAALARQCFAEPPAGKQHMWQRRNKQQKQRSMAHSTDKSDSDTESEEGAEHTMGRQGQHYQQQQHGQCQSRLGTGYGSNNCPCCCHCCGHATGCQLHRDARLRLNGLVPCQPQMEGKPFVPHCSHMGLQQRQQQFFFGQRQQGQQQNLLIDGSDVDANWQQQSRGSTGCSSMEQSPAWLQDDAADLLGAGTADQDSRPAHRQDTQQQQQQQGCSNAEEQQDEGESSLVHMQTSAPADSLFSPVSNSTLHSLASVQPIHHQDGLVPVRSRYISIADELVRRGRSCSCSGTSLRRPPSPVLGPIAADVVVGGQSADLLKGLEEDFQHAASMFGCAQQNQVFADMQLDAEAQQEAAAAAQKLQAEQVQGAKTSPRSKDLGPSALEGAALCSAAAIDSAATHSTVSPDSPSSCSHSDELQLFQDWDFGVDKPGPQDPELSAEMAAAAAAAGKASTAGAPGNISGTLASAASSLMDAAVLGPPISRQRQQSEEAQLLVRAMSVGARPDLQLQLQDCRQQLHASWREVVQLTQQLSDKDEQLTALTVKAAKQAKQLQQHASEITALKVQLTRLQGSGRTLGCTGSDGSSRQQQQQHVVRQEGSGTRAGAALAPDDDDAPCRAIRTRRKGMECVTDPTASALHPQPQTSKKSASTAIGHGSSGASAMQRNVSSCAPDLQHKCRRQHMSLMELQRVCNAGVVEQQQQAKGSHGPGQIRATAKAVAGNTVAGIHLTRQAVEQQHQQGPATAAYATAATVAAAAAAAAATSAGWELQASKEQAVPSAAQVFRRRPLQLPLAGQSQAQANGISAATRSLAAAVAALNNAAAACANGGSSNSADRAPAPLQAVAALPSNGFLAPSGSADGAGPVMLLQQVQQPSQLAAMFSLNAVLSRLAGTNASSAVPLTVQAATAAKAAHGTARGAQSAAATAVAGLHKAGTAGTGSAADGWLAQAIAAAVGAGASGSGAAGSGNQEAATAASTCGDTANHQHARLGRAAASAQEFAGWVSAADKAGDDAAEVAAAVAPFAAVAPAALILS